ncbi:MAG: M15 family metallopeptidase [Actinomycetota bacterium]
MSGGIVLALFAATTAPGGAVDESTTTTTSTTAPSTTASSSTSTTAASTTSTTVAPTTSTTVPSTTSSTAADATTSTTAAGGTTTSSGGSGAPDFEESTDEANAEAAAKAAALDAANAELGDLTNALAVLKRQVDSQQAEVDYANLQLTAAEQLVADSEAAVSEAEVELVALEERVSTSAIQAFMDGETGQIILFAADDPLDAIRKDVMRSAGTQTDLELVEQLKIVQSDLDVRQAEALDAADAAEQVRVASQEALSALEGDQAAQVALASSAEDRLDRLLGENAALAALGAQGVDTSALAAELANSNSSANINTNIQIPSTVSEDDIVYAGNGISVHRDIVDNIRQLLVDAAADGVDLGGGGYRSPAAQIATRRNNCGTSNYAIYEMPASQCSPPTARPGRSMHEKGLAIDFTYNGSLIRSRSGPGWNWLVANAARYGLKNLPSEPWHWSTNGN